MYAIRSYYALHCPLSSATRNLIDEQALARMKPSALLNTASGATWVSIHHGGGVGMGYAQHAGLVIVCDGSEAADRRIARVLWNDPGTGVMRHSYNFV